jgi:hypothetical protein
MSQPHNEADELAALCAANAALTQRLREIEECSLMPNMSVVDPQPETPRRHAPLFTETETFTTLQTPNGPTMPQIHCQFTRGITYGNQLGMKDYWTLRGCDAISAECSYELFPAEDLDRLYVDHRENISGRAVQRSIRTIALVPQAENVGSRHAGLYHLGRKHRRQAWLPIQLQALLLPSARSPPSDAPKLNDSIHAPEVEPTLTAMAEPCVVQFQDMYVRDRPHRTKRRAYQQYLDITIEMYADVRADGSEAPEWIKVAQRRSNPIIMFGRVGGKTEFPIKPHRRRQPI